MKSVLTIFLSGFILLTATSEIFAQATCSNPFTPVATPLIDMGSGTYIYYPDRENPQNGSRIYKGGLFDNGSNNPPESHRTNLLTISQNIKPLSTRGGVDTQNGTIGFISIGMSNTSMEFGPFASLSNNNPEVNPKVKIVNTALSNAAADSWDESTDIGWTNAISRIESSNLSRNQIEVAWMKLAIIGPQNEPDHIESLYNYLVNVVRTAKSLLPNLKIIYVSSRTRSYAVNPLGVRQTGLNSEPFAFESAFSARKLILEQINNPLGPLNLQEAPFLTWGPYLWIDGENPRSDGLVWLASDLNTDCTHPSANGIEKVKDQLFDFFLSDPGSVYWFPRNPVATTSSPTPTIANTSGDADGDGKVNGVDYQIWLNNYNTNSSGAVNGDFNNSGNVDNADYTIWLSNFSS